MKEMEVLNIIVSSYLEILKDNLVGIYLHGSIAFGCFNPKKSDIDFIVVVKQSLNLHEKKQLIQILLDLDKYCPKKGLEMSVVKLDYCLEFCYPTPFELHYSNLHKEKYSQNLEEYCQKMYGLDEDLAAHFKVIFHRGICLYGKPILEVFVEVPKIYYWRSIVSDIKNAVELMEKKPTYTLLNLCRTLAFQEEELILSKQEGGEWAIQKYPQYKNIISRFLQDYTDRVDTPLSVDAEVKEFVEYVLKRLNLKEISS